MLVAKFYELSPIVLMPTDVLFEFYLIFVGNKEGLPSLNSNILSQTFLNMVLHAIKQSLASRCSQRFTSGPSIFVVSNLGNPTIDTAGCSGDVVGINNHKPSPKTLEIGSQLGGLSLFYPPGIPWGGLGDAKT